MTKIPAITSYIKRPRLKWFGHVKRRGKTNKAKAIMEWQPEGKKPKKCGLDGIKQDL